MEYFLLLVSILILLYISWYTFKLNNEMRPDSEIKKTIHEVEQISDKLEKEPEVEPKNHIENNAIEYNIDEWKNETLIFFDNTFSLSDFLITKDINEIYYADLLNCFEWKYKRLIILFRDKYSCIDCGSESLKNHVHHLYYLQNKLPWEIDDNGLVTLCPTCHKKRHEKSIPVYKIENGTFVEVSNEKPVCYRCGGIGYIDIFHYYHNGICFSCLGNTISQSVFQNILKYHYENLNNYNDEKKRNQYKYFLNKITIEDFTSSYPNKNRYIKQSKDYFDDDLPF